MYKKKLAIFGLVSMMMLSMTACASKPKTTSEVLDQNTKAMEKVSSFEVDGTTTLNVDVNVPSQNVSMNIPATVDYDVKTDGKTAGYVEMGINIDLPEGAGEDVDLDVKAYVEKTSDTKLDVWVNQAPNTDWYHTVTDMTESTADDVSANVLIDGTLSSSDTEYVVTQTVKSIIDSDSFKEGVKEGLERSDTDLNIDDTLSSIGLSVDDIKDQLGKGEIKYVFDSETFYLTSVTLDDMNVTASIEQNNTTIDIKLGLKSENKIKNYNGLDKSDYMVPDDIKDSAEELGDTPITDIGNETTDTTTEESSTEVDTETKSDTNSSEDLSTGEYVSSIGQASYNKSLFEVGSSFDKIFGNYGWKIDESSDGEYSFICATNDDYPYCNLYLFGVDTENNETIDHIKESGLSGFDVEYSGDIDPNNVMPLSVNGITFGMTRDDVLAKFSNPTYHYKSDSAESFEYDTADGSSVEFWLTNGVVSQISYRYR